MSRTRWSGSEVRAARAMWAPRLPVPCARCRRPVVPDPTKRDDGWQVDHWPIPREQGGTQTWPAHARCNLAAGGRRGAAITNANKRAAQAAPRTTERMNNIRGV